MICGYKRFRKNFGTCIQASDVTMESPVSTENEAI